MGFIKKSSGSTKKIISFLLAMTIVLSLAQFQVYADKISDSQYSDEAVALEEAAREAPVEKAETWPEDMPPVDTRSEEMPSEEVMPKNLQPDDIVADATWTENRRPEDIELKNIQLAGLEFEDTRTDQMPEEVPITYDAQPLTLEQVQEAIDMYETEYKAVLFKEGLSAAAKVPKPHWQYNVAEELMPYGYSCQRVDMESDIYDGFGAEYYTFFVGAVSTALVVDGGTGVIVETEGDFRAALANTAYTTIYFGIDITMTAISNNIVAARTGQLVISGIDPRDGSRHSYTDYNASTTTAALGGPCADIVFRDMNIRLRNSSGIFYPTITTGTTVTLENVTMDARQAFGGRGINSTLVIKDSVVTLINTGLGVPEEFAQNAGMVRFEGDVTVKRAVAAGEEFFELVSSSTVEIAEDANVLLDNSVNTNVSGYVFNYVTNLMIGEGASFSCLSNTAAFCIAVPAQTFRNITIGDYTDVRFIYTGSSSHSTRSLYGTTGNSTLTAGVGSNFLLYDNESEVLWSVCYFANIVLNNPESFVVLNRSERAVGTTYIPKLTVTGVSSIRYYPVGQIPLLFNTGTYVYTPSRTPSNWWAQSSPFDVEKASWSTASSVTMTSYTFANKPTASISVMDTLTDNNFTATSSVYGIEIYGRIFKLTYDGNNADTGTVPASDSGVPRDLMTVRANTGNLVREGYIFTGWNTEPDGSGDHYNVGSTFRITEDTILYAEWEKDPEKFATISYFANNGTDDMLSEDWLKGKDYSIITNPFSNEGYVFNGWNTQANGQGVNYSEDELIVLSGDVMLYARWKALPKSLVFRKIDAATANADAVTPLEGAEFALYYCDSVSHKNESDHTSLGETASCWVLSDIGADYNGSIVVFEGLEDGAYLLMETVSPDGYQLPKGQWIIKIEDGEILFVGISGNADVPAVVSSANFGGREGDDSVEFWIGNIAQYELPVSGRSGTLWFTTLGLLLLAAGASLACLYRRRSPATDT